MYIDTCVCRHTQTTKYITLALWLLVLHVCMLVFQSAYVESQAPSACADVRILSEAETGSSI